MPLLKCTGNHLVYMEKDNNIPFAIFVRAGFIGYINEFILGIDIAKLTEYEGQWTSMKSFCKL